MFPYYSNNKYDLGTCVEVEAGEVEAGGEADEVMVRSSCHRSSCSRSRRSGRSSRSSSGAVIADTAVSRIISTSSWGYG